jgi:hypothetical protein
VTDRSPESGMIYMGDASFTEIVNNHQKIVASPYMALGCIKVGHS